MKLYGDPESGNCLKVKWTADYLRLPCEWVAVPFLEGGTHTPDFLRLNPMAQVPALVLDDGRPLAQSNAIITYLAEGTFLLPADKYERAKVNELLYWEQYSHEPYIAACRFQMKFKGISAEQRENWRVERGEAALDFMEQQLAERAWLAGDGLTIADISLLAYTRMAGEGGFSLADRPNVRAWIARAEEALGLRATA